MASLGYSKMSIQKVAESLSGIGYDAVSLPLSHFDPDMGIEKLKSVRRVLEEHDLAISEIVVQQDLIVLDREAINSTVAYIRNCIERFSQIGIPCIHLFSGPRSWVPDPVKLGRDISEGAAWDMLFSVFDQLLPVAEKNKVRLAVENVWGMLVNDFYTNRFLQDHYKSEHLGVMLDPSHDVLKGNLDLGWVVKNWGEKIFHVHLKDAAGIQEKGRFLFPLLGEGNVEWEDFFKELMAVRYSGYCSVEFESFAYLSRVLKDDIEKAAKISFDALRELIPH